MIRQLALIMFAGALAGCTFRPTIISASVVKIDEASATVRVRLKLQDVATIKRKQFYFSLVTVNCSGDPNRFPIEPYIGDQRATEFKFSLPQNDVDLTGTIPMKILNQYRKPCVFLEGGSYISGKIASGVAPLVEN